MQDYEYTILREGERLFQRQVFQGVGVVTICENQAAKVAEVSAMTDYGNYCYFFDSTSDIVALLHSTDDYLMGKFLDGHGERRVLDVEATIKAIFVDMGLKKNFLLPPDEAWACRNQLVACTTEAEMETWAAFWDYGVDRLRPLKVYSYGEAAREFMHRVLPLIRESADRLSTMRTAFMASEMERLSAKLSFSASNLSSVVTLATEHLVSPQGKKGE